MRKASTEGDHILWAAYHLHRTSILSRLFLKCQINWGYLTHYSHSNFTFMVNYRFFLTKFLCSILGTVITRITGHENTVGRSSFLNLNASKKSKSCRNWGKDNSFLRILFYSITVNFKFLIHYKCWVILFYFIVYYLILLYFSLYLFLFFIFV